MSAVEIRGFVSISIRGVMDELGPRFETGGGHKLALTFNTSAVLNEHLHHGDVVDLMITSRSGMDDLIKTGLALSDSDVTLAHSRVGVAVPPGSPKPDISTPETLKRTLCAARAIGYSDPSGGGTSGVHFAKVIERLGIAEEIQAKTKFPPVGTYTAALLLNGEVDIAIQQISELNFVSGAELVGPLPENLQLVTTFVGGIHAKANAPVPAKALLQFLRTPEAAAVIKDKGLEAA